jgi:hypothetical protein
VTPREETQLRALVAIAWKHRGTSALREDVAAIVDWNLMRVLARGELDELRTDAFLALEAELRIRQLIWIIRESYPLSYPVAA